MQVIAEKSEIFKLLRERKKKKERKYTNLEFYAL